MLECFPGHKTLYSFFYWFLQNFSFPNSKVWYQSLRYLVFWRHTLLVFGPSSNFRTKRPPASNSILGLSARWPDRKPHLLWRAFTMMTTSFPARREKRSKQTRRFRSSGAYFSNNASVITENRQRDGSKKRRAVHNYSWPSPRCSGRETPSSGTAGSKIDPKWQGSAHRFGNETLETPSRDRRK